MGVNRPRIVESSDQAVEPRVPSHVPKNVARTRPRSLAEYDPMELAVKRARRDIEAEGGEVIATVHAKGKTYIQWVSRNNLPCQTKVSLGPKVVG